MKRLQKILCFVSASAEEQVALQRASKLAERNGAVLKIVDVVDDAPGWLGMSVKSLASVLERA